jgi:cysteinyl-tRNA synthetase
VQKWGARDYELNEALSRAQTTVHQRLADNFDTPEAVKALSELVGTANSYLQQDRALIKVPLVRQVSRYVLKVLKVFGLYEDDIVPAAASGAEAATQEEAIAPIMDLLAKARDQLKDRASEGPAVITQICTEHLQQITDAAKGSKSEDVQQMLKVATDFLGQAGIQDGGVKALFQLCDDLRDDVLPHLGVRLEDRAKGQPALWKYEDREVLLKERQAKIADREKKEEEKRKRKEEETRKKSTPAQNWFREFRAAEFTQFDDAGLPTHDAKGKELSESIRNKLKKDWNKQNEVYQKWLTEQAAASGKAAQ